MSVFENFVKLLTDVVVGNTLNYRVLANAQSFLGAGKEVQNHTKGSKLKANQYQFLIYGAKMLEKCVKSKKRFSYIVLFCKVKQSKMPSIKSNKIKK